MQRTEEKFYLTNRKPQIICYHRVTTHYYSLEFLKITFLPIYELCQIWNFRERIKCVKKDSSCWEVCTITPKHLILILRNLNILVHVFCFFIFIPSDDVDSEQQITSDGYKSRQIIKKILELFQFLAKYVQTSFKLNENWHRSDAQRFQRLRLCVTFHHLMLAKNALYRNIKNLPHDKKSHSNLWIKFTAFVLTSFFVCDGSGWHYMLHNTQYIVHSKGGSWYAFK